MKKVKKLLEKWDALTMELSEYGAADTEPTVVFEQVIMKFLETGKNPLPLTASQWQLYTCGMDCEDAAQRLNEFVQKIIDALGNLKYHEVLYLKEYLGI